MVGTPGRTIRSAQVPESPLGGGHERRASGFSVRWRWALSLRLAELGRLGSCWAYFNLVRLDFPYHVVGYAFLCGASTHWRAVAPRANDIEDQVTGSASVVHPYRRPPAHNMSAMSDHFLARRLCEVPHFCGLFDQRVDEPGNTANSSGEGLDRLVSLGARWAFAAADRCVSPRLPILIFHRVLAYPDPLFPAEVDARRFDRLMRIVARSFTVLTFGEALSALERNSLPTRPLVITFDDGYADNAEVALPILRRHRLAATVFVASGFLDGGRMWNDTVIECIRRTRLEHIDLTDLGLGRFPLSGVADRRAAIDAVLPRLKYLSLAGREFALEQLHRLAGLPELPRDLMMSSAQVLALQRSGMEVGSHTVNHPILTKLSEGDALKEIEDGRAHLQTITGAAVDVFAYPNGLPGRDYDASHVAMLRRLGIRGAASTAVGVAGTGSDPLQLPRFTPWDREPQRWAARLLWNRLRGGHYAIAPE